MSWPDMWGKVFIVSSEDGEKAIVVVRCEMSGLIRIMNREVMNRDRTTSDQSSNGDVLEHKVQQNGWVVKS